MANSKPNTKNLTPWQPGQSGNPKGKKVGTKNYATVVKALLDDPQVLDRLIKSKHFKEKTHWAKEIGMSTGTYAVITAIMVQAMQGDVRAASWLKDQGWGPEIETESPEERKIVITTFATKGDL